MNVTNDWIFEDADDGNIICIQPTNYEIYSLRQGQNSFMEHSPKILKF